MKNESIKKYAKSKCVKLWQLAEELGLKDSNFSKELRHTLSPAREAEVIRAVERIAARRDECKEGSQCMIPLYTDSCSQSKKRIEIDREI